MARIGILFGLLLFGLTIAGVCLTTHKSYTQFVPMMFGIPMLFLGVVALNPHRRVESVRAALVLMFGGLLLGGGRVLFLTIAWCFGGDVNPLSFQLVAAMTSVCGIFVLFAEQWRRARRRSEEKRLQAKSATPLSTVVTPNPAVSDPVTRVRVDNDNPYQPPPILNESTPASSSQSTDH